MNKIFICICTIFFMISCSQKTQEVKPEISEKAVKNPQEEVNGQYDEYLLLMSDSQRAQFFKLENELHKKRFLQAEGIYRKKEIEDSLTDKMSTEEVASVLGQPNDKETNMYDGEKEIRWTFVEFNNYRNMKYTIIFKNGAFDKDSWYLWLD